MRQFGAAAATAQLWGSAASAARQTTSATRQRLSQFHRDSSAVGQPPIRKKGERHEKIHSIRP